MSGKVQKTALGKQISIENLLLQNPTTIAVGNARVNARGDQLGPGGKIVKTRDQIMKEYYALNTPVVTEVPIQPQAQQPTIRPDVAPQPVIQQPVIQQPVIQHIPQQLIPTPVPPVIQPQVQPVAAPVVIPEPITAPIPVEVKPPAPAAQAVPGIHQPGIIIQSDPTLRGSLADAVAKSTIVNQETHLPPNKANGIVRF
jgi:hypothetical protein